MRVEYHLNMEIIAEVEKVNKNGEIIFSLGKTVQCSEQTACFPFKLHHFLFLLLLS